jgi:hypothetical protein
MTRRLKLVVIAAALICGTAGYGTYRVWHWYDETRMRFRCENQMRDLTSTVFFYDLRNAQKGMPDLLLDRDKLRYHDGKKVDSLGVCPCCGKPYVYSPVSPSGERFFHDSSSSSAHFILWCPMACHGGKRIFLMSDFSHFPYSDKEVSFYFQKVVYGDWVPEERVIETKYREENGLPKLPPALR